MPVFGTQEAVPGAGEVVVWVPKPGGTMRFGTRMIAPCLVGMLLWVPKDYYLLLFSTRRSVRERMDSKSWVVKHAYQGGNVTYRRDSLWHVTSYLGTRGR